MYNINSSNPGMRLSLMILKLYLVQSLLYIEETNKDIIIYLN